MNRPRWTTSARLSPARLTRPLGLQGQWCCWRPRTTVRTGTWARVVSRVGTLIDKRQPKLHVRMNFHGTYARAPYSEHRLYIPFSWRKRSTLPRTVMSTTEHAHTSNRISESPSEHFRGYRGAPVPGTYSATSCKVHVRFKLANGYHHINCRKTRC